MGGTSIRPEGWDWRDSDGNEIARPLMGDQNIGGRRVEAPPLISRTEMNQAETMYEKRARLCAELDAVDAELKTAAEAAKASAISDIRELMQAHGITLADIDSKPEKKKRERKAAGGRQPGTYTHPDGRTHVEKPGRGRRPGWLGDEGVTVT